MGHSPLLPPSIEDRRSPEAMSILSVTFAKLQFIQTRLLRTIQYSPSSSPAVPGSPEVKTLGKATIFPHSAIALHFG